MKFHPRFILWRSFPALLNTGYVELSCILTIQVSVFQAYAAAGTVNQNYADILLMLLRPSQACGHPLLVKGFNSESVEKDSAEMAKQLPREMVVDLLNRLETSFAPCHVCNASYLKNIHFLPLYSMPLVRSCCVFSLLLP